MGAEINLGPGGEGGRLRAALSSVPWKVPAPLLNKSSSSCRHCALVQVCSAQPCVALLLCCKSSHQDCEGS